MKALQGLRAALIALIIASTSLGLAGQGEIVKDTVYLSWIAYTDTTGAFLVTKELRYADGGLLIQGEVIGDSAATRTYLLNQVIDDQRQEANAIAQVANSNQRQQKLNTYSALIQQVGGRGYTDEVANLYFNQLQGRYRVSVSGQANFVATLIRLPNGAVRLEREDDQTRYTVNIFTDRSLSVRNLPGATGDQKLALWQTTTRGLPVYATPTRNVRLTRLLDSELSARSGQ